MALTLKIFERSKTEDVWHSDSGQAISEVADLARGRYRFKFRCGLSGFVVDNIYEPLLRGLIGTDLPIGKKVIIEDIYYLKPENTFNVILDIRENPIPIAIILGAVAGIAGLGLLALTLVKIEKLVRPENIAGLLIIGSIVILSLIYIRDIFKVITKPFGKIAV